MAYVSCSHFMLLTLGRCVCVWKICVSNHGGTYQVNLWSYFFLVLFLFFNYNHHEIAHATTHNAKEFENDANDGQMKLAPKADEWHAKFLTRTHIHTHASAFGREWEKRKQKKTPTNVQRKLLIFIMTLYLNKTMNNCNANNDKSPNAKMCYCFVVVVFFSVYVLVDSVCV